jgi:hypothetical protein
MRTALLALMGAAALGCGDSDRPNEALPRDSASQEVQPTPGGATEVPSASERHFDPNGLSAGDTHMNLRVTDVDVRRVLGDSVWSGRVRFAGEIRVSGVYQRHFDWPEPDARCFHVDDAAAGAVPDFAPDTWTSPGMKVWFCFTNPERAEELLGSGETPRHATIAVDDYLVTREFSDVFDTARLVRAESVGGPARQTLRDP